MIKSFMPYCDVLFPISLGPLTYICPEDMAETAEPGMVVAAPLKNRLTKGILLNKNASPPPGPIKELAKICSDTPVLSRNMLRLLRWMSDYYLSSEGVVLKQTVPAEIFIRTKAKNSGKAVSAGMPLVLADVPLQDT